MLNKKSEKGQAIIMIVFAMIGLIGITALAVDGGMAYADKRGVQGAVDSAAWAAGLANARGNDIVASALAVAAANGYDNGAQNDVVVSFTDVLPAACPYNNGQGKDITVEITSHVKTFFAPVVGINQITNKVKASSRSCDVYTTVNTAPFYPGSSVYATSAPSSCNGSTRTVQVNGTANIQLWGGGFGSAGTDVDCMNFQGGITSLKLSEVGSPKTCATLTTASASLSNLNGFAGSEGACKTGSAPNVTYNATPPTPPADLGITCSGDAIKTGNALSPGNWPGSTGATGSFPQTGVTKLNPGVYCVTGDFTKSGPLTGLGVTIVLKTGVFNLTGGEIKLTAPTSGNTTGLVVYMPPSNASSVHWNGNVNVDVTGSLIMQSADCLFNGGVQIQHRAWQMICSTWTSDGNSTIEGSYDPSQLYIPPGITVNPTISLLK